MKIIHRTGSATSKPKSGLKSQPFSGNGSSTVSESVTGSDPGSLPESGSVLASGSESDPVSGSLSGAGTIPYLAILMIFPVLTLLSFTAYAGDDPRDNFLKNYAGYCGNTYGGETRYIDLGENHPLDGATLLMEFRDCSEYSVRIPFVVNSDSSRTWILLQTPQGLYFTHDHRYPDGSQYANNFYGGYADDSGSEVKQFFPADHRTVLDRPVRSANVWSIEFDHERKSYFYRLYLDGELRYVAEFDLSEPVR